MSQISVNHESKSSKNSEIKNCRSRVIQMMEQYRRPPEEKNPSHNGPLCFLPGLFTSSIAVSGKSRKRWPGFQAFVEETILENDEEVLSFFDADKNIEAFRKTPLMGVDLSQACSHDTSFGYPPALLLAKARKVEERCFLEYVEETDVEREQDGQSETKYKLSNKETAYQNWLFSLAFYEICVLDYYGRFVSGEIADDLNSLEELRKEPGQLLSPGDEHSAACGSSDETARKLQEALDRVKEIANKLLESTYHTVFLLFLTDHILSLFAVLEILLLIEFCNIGCAENGKMDSIHSRNDLYRKVRKKAISLECGLGEWDMDDKHQDEMEPYVRNLLTMFEKKDRKEREGEIPLMNLIMPPEKWLRGYENSVNNVLKITFMLHPSYWEEKDEKAEDAYLFANLSAYIHSLRLLRGNGFVDSELEKKTEEIMDHVRIYLAMPIWEYLNHVKEEETKGE